MGDPLGASEIIGNCDQSLYLCIFCRLKVCLCDAKSTGKYLLTFRRSLMPSSSDLDNPKVKWAHLRRHEPEHDGTTVRRNICTY